MGVHLDGLRMRFIDRGYKKAATINAAASFSLCLKKINNILQHFAWAECYFYTLNGEVYQCGIFREATGELAA